VPMMYRTCPGTLITTRTEYVRTDGNATSTPHTHHSKRHLDRQRFASLSGRTVSHSRRPRGRSGGCRTYRDHCPATPVDTRRDRRQRWSRRTRYPPTTRQLGADPVRDDDTTIIVF